jgi:hypothetical protein
VKVRHNVWKSILIVCLLFSVVAIFVCFIADSECYEWLFVLPFTYCICSMILLTQRMSLTGTIINLCAFLRYVLIPIMQSLFPVYGFSSFSCTDTETINKAIALMCYELIVITIFITIYLQLHRNVESLSKQDHEDVILNRFDTSHNHYGAILIFIVFSVLLVCVSPVTLQQISFIAIRSNTTSRIGSVSASSSTLDMIARQFFVIGFLSLFVICVLKLKQSKLKETTALNISLLCAAACTSIIISEQRSSQVYCAFAAIILLIQVYPQKKKKIIRTIGIVFIIVILLLSAYKTFYAFKYGSYSAAIANSNFSPYSITQTLEIYLLGPQTVASAIKFNMAYPSFSSIGQLFYDICRSTIGISFFVKDGGRALTSAQYNLFVTRGASTSGYLLPITAQGYIVFGAVFAPILICLCIWLAFKIEKKMFNSKSAYVTFFSAYVYVRLATCIISSNLNTVLNAISSILISAGLIYLIQFSISKMTHKNDA